MNGELVWFYLQNGKSLGPFSKDQLLQLSFSAAIPKDTLIWSSDQKQEWKPLQEVFNLKEELPPPLPTAQPELVTNIVSIPTLDLNPDNKPHPWRRYLARMLDNTANGTVMGLAIGAILGVIAPAEANRFFVFIGDPKNKFVDIFLTCLMVPFANAAFIGFTGTSIGKWFFGVKVVDNSNRAIGYSLALKREFLVWLYGLGCGVPIANVVAALHQLSQLNKKKITSWDKDLNLKIVYRKNEAAQYFLSVMGFVLLIAIYTALAKL